MVRGKILLVLIFLSIGAASAQSIPDHPPHLLEIHKIQNPFAAQNAPESISQVQSIPFQSQIATATQITDCVQITQPGYYYLVNNISASGTCIYIASSDVVIDGSGYAIVGYGLGSGVDAENVVNITVKNLMIEGFYTGIHLYNTTNSIIENNTISDNNWSGIGLYYSSSNILSNNTVINNGGEGIWLVSSSFNIISNNTISNNTWEGIGLYLSSSNTITNNSLITDVILPYYSFNNTVTNNTVNGKPLVYLENVRDYTVTDAGQVIAINSRNITVRDLNLSYTDIGVFFFNTTNSIITNNTIFDNNWDGIWTGDSFSNTITDNTIISISNRDGIHLYNTTNSIIENNTILGSSEHGIGLYYSSSNIVSNNTVINNGGEGIWISYSSSNTITDNTILNNSEGGIHLYNTTNSIIENNTISDNNWSGIELVFSSSNIVSNNTISNNTWEGIRLYLSSSNTITDNTILNNSEGGISLASSFSNTITENAILNNSGIGIHLYNTTNSIIENNTISDNNWDGIQLAFSSSNIVSNNTISNNNWGGILISYSSSNTITENTILNNSEGGIHLYNTTNSIIENNTISDNNLYGIGLAFSSSNIVSNNTFINNGGEGIWISDSSFNIISYNTISNNEHGIWINSSSSNIIYLNTFISNSNHVWLRDSSNNIWNSTHPITYTYNNSTFTNYMGNYWDDYNGTDSDGDGIGDTPYQVDLGNLDNYPLIQPAENYFAAAPTYTPVPELKYFNLSEGMQLIYIWNNTLHNPNPVIENVTLTELRIEPWNAVRYFFDFDNSGGAFGHYAIALDNGYFQSRGWHTTSQGGFPSLPLPMYASFKYYVPTPMILPANASTGDSWTGENNLYGYPVNYTSYIVGFENVTTPAGVFYCAKVITYIESTHSYINGTRTMWIGEPGLVKLIYNHSDGSVTRVELAEISTVQLPLDVIDVSITPGNGYVDVNVTWVGDGVIMLGPINFTALDYVYINATAPTTETFRLNLSLNAPSDYYFVHVVDRDGYIHFGDRIYVENFAAPFLTVPSTTIVVNSTAEIPLFLSLPVNVTGINFTLHYDPSIVQIDSYSLRVPSTSFANVDNINGTAKFAIVFNDTVSGYMVPILNVTIRATSVGITNLSVTGVEVSLTDFSPIPGTAMNGTLTVIGQNGDINGDGKVTIADMTNLAWMLFGKVQQDSKADFNSNGRIDIGDLAKLAYYILGKIMAI